MSLKDQTAIVGIGATPYYKRGESRPLTETELACQSILGALDDAGLTIKDLDGFALYSASVDPAALGAILGVPEMGCAASTKQMTAKSAVQPLPPAVVETGGSNHRDWRAWPAARLAVEGKCTVPPRAG